MANDDNQEQANTSPEHNDEASPSRGRRRRGGRRRRSAEPKQEVDTTSSEQTTQDAPTEDVVASKASEDESPTQEKEEPTSKRRRGGRRRRRNDNTEQDAVEATADEASKDADTTSDAPAVVEAKAEAKPEEATPQEETPSAPKKEARPEKPTLRPAQYQKQGRVWLETLFGHMNLNVTPKGSYNKDTKTLHFDIEGDDRNALLGRNNASPRSLENIQKLLSEALSLHGTKYQVHVDIENFRTQRTERLEALAVRLSKKSKGINRAFVVAGLNDFERRVVHQALTDSKDVKTESQGVGIFRKLRLEPSEA